MFLCAFPSIVRQMRWYNSQRQGTAHPLPKLIVFFFVLFVCKCVLYHSHRVSTLTQLTNISIYTFHCFTLLGFKMPNFDGEILTVTKIKSFVMEHRNHKTFIQQYKQIKN